MSTYEKSLLKQIVLRTILVSLVILAPLWLIQALHFLALVPGHHINVFLFLYISLLMLPSALAIIIPITCCLSILSVYHAMDINSESTILSSFGLKPLTICKPAILCGLLCALLGYLLSLYITPLSWRTFHRQETSIRSKAAFSNIPTKIFVPLTSDITLYVGKVDQNKIEKIVLHDARNHEKETTIFADYGELDISGSSPRIKLYNGSTQSLSKSDQLSFMRFNRFDFTLPNISSVHKNDMPLSDISSLELFRIIQTHGYEDTKLITELGARITSPIYSLIYVFIITLALISNLITKGRRMASVVALSSIALCIPLQFSLISFSRSHPLFLILLFAVPIVLSLGLCLKLLMGELSTSSTLEAA